MENVNNPPPMERLLEGMQTPLIGKNHSLVMLSFKGTCNEQILDPYKSVNVLDYQEHDANGGLASHSTHGWSESSKPFV